MGRAQLLDLLVGQRALVGWCVHVRSRRNDKVLVEQRILAQLDIPLVKTEDHTGAVGRVDCVGFRGAGAHPLTNDVRVGVRSAIEAAYVLGTVDLL